MKLFLNVLFFILIAACSSSPFGEVKSAFSFKDFQELKPGQTKKSEVLSKFGGPATKETVEGIEKWTFNENGYQRLTLSFSKTDFLISSLWMPQDTDSESHLDAVLKLFPSGKFKKFQTVQKNPHTALSTSVSLVDYNSGVSLLVEDESNVQAIASFDSKLTRETASQNQPQLNIPVTIGK